MDDLDRAVIDALQDGMAVCERPFAAAAEALGVEEAVLIERLRGLLAEGVLTRFGPMYDAERLGGAVTLAAMRVPAERLDAVAAEVNAFEEVAHNYEREHELNLWFVLATETPAAIAPVLEAIASRTGYPVYDMPKLEEYYIGLKLHAGEGDPARKPALRRPAAADAQAHEPAVSCSTGGRGASSGYVPAGASSQAPHLHASTRPRHARRCDPRAGAVRRAQASTTSGPASRRPAAAPLDATDRAIVAATQAGLPLVPRPCHAIAAELGLDPAQVMRCLQRMLDTGAIRRIAAVPNHYALGYRANGMSVWDVDDAEVAEAGRGIGALTFVSHCYLRPRHPPLWPYNLFAMVHGRSRTEVEAHVAEIAARLGGRQRAHDVLYSRRILKKTGLRLQSRTGVPDAG